MQPFGIDTEDKNDISVIRLYGRMQLADTELVESVAKAYLAKGGTKLIVDLTDLDCLHSAGIGLLLELTANVRERGGSVYITGAGEAILDTLRTLGVLPVLEIRDSQEDAIRELS